MGDPDDGTYRAQGSTQKDCIGVGVHGMRGTAGQIKPLGLGLNLKSVQLGERTEQQELTARGQRWRSGLGTQAGQDTGVCSLPGTEVRGAQVEGGPWETGGVQLGNKLFDVHSYRHSQGHFHFDTGADLPEQGSGLPDLRPQAVGEVAEADHSSR